MRVQFLRRKTSTHFSLSLTEPSRAAGKLSKLDVSSTLLKNIFDPSPSPWNYSLAALVEGQSERLNQNPANPSKSL